jgi:hypothetical protein
VSILDKCPLARGASRTTSTGGWKLQKTKGSAGRRRIERVAADAVFHSRVICSFQD